MNEEYLDKITKLFANGKYKEVIDNTQNDFNPEIVFLRMKSYIALNEYENAYNLYLLSREQLEDYDLIKAGKLYIYLLIELKKPLSLLINEIEHFKCRPYVNQETEEFLITLDQFILELKDSLDYNSENFIDYPVEEILEMFKSKSAEIVLQATNYAFTNERFKQIDLTQNVIEILNEKNDYDLTYWILFEFLIWNQVDQNFLVKIGENYFTLNPSKLLYKKNVQAQLINEKVEFIQNHEKDMTIMGYVVPIIDQGSYFLAPDYLSNEDEANSYIFAVYRYVFKLFNITENEDTLFEYFKIHSNKNKSDKYYKILLLVR
ncbi:MAG: hypothetical protein IJ186_04495 [Bacilli bacterium]|nr:hypothetical protein [Bacilli bacterium]